MNYKRGSIGLFFRGDPTLKLWLPFEENSGNYALDLSGGGHNGTLSGSPLRTSGKVGNGLYFSGPNTKVLVTNEIVDGKGDFTYSVWFRTNYSSADYLDQVILRRDSYNESLPRGLLQIAFNLDANHLGLVACGIYQDASHNIEGMYSTKKYNDNLWHWVTFTRGGNTLYFYVDSILQGTTGINYTLDGNTFYNAVGEYVYANVSGKGNFQGYIDEPAIFSRALSPKEISDYYLWSIGTPQRRILYAPQINVPNFFPFF